ncbi:MAG TPA: M23 family metallopeptidase [Nocardioidaceae bacterium]|jgi:murein DD-endopeptidase MepM/ murein hydrolase activator NlpD
MALLAHLVVLLTVVLSSGGVWPLDPRPDVVAGFSPPATRWGAGHRGVDLAGRAGQTVRAAAGGTVSFAGKIAGRGVVVVDHGATRTTYEPVDASVRVGAPVRPGDPIGTLQRFGSHCWPAACLHWGLIEGDATYLDPLTLVGAGPVRLLPLWSPLPRPPQVRLAAVPAEPVTAEPPTDGLRFARPVA